MKKYLTINNDELIIEHIKLIRSSYGHYTLVVLIKYKNEQYIEKKTITDSELYDNYKEAIDEGCIGSNWLIDNASYHVDNLIFDFIEKQ